MNRGETVKIVKLIATLYAGKFKIDPDEAADVINAWHNVLKDHEFEVIEANLNAYVSRNHFPPSVSDLLQIEDPVSRAIPSKDETLAMLEKWDRAKANAASKETAAAALAEIRKKLGIKRGE